MEIDPLLGRHARRRPGTPGSRGRMPASADRPGDDDRIWGRAAPFTI